MATRLQDFRRRTGRGTTKLASSIAPITGGVVIGRGTGTPQSNNIDPSDPRRAVNRRRVDTAPLPQPEPIRPQNPSVRSNVPVDGIQTIQSNTIGASRFGGRTAAEEMSIQALEDAKKALANADSESELLGFNRAIQAGQQLTPSLETEKGQELLRQQAFQEKELGFQQAAAGTIRGSRAGEQRQLQQDLFNQQKRALEQERINRQRFIFAAAEGARADRLQKLAQELELSKQQRIQIAADIENAGREADLQFAQQEFQAGQSEAGREFQAQQAGLQRDFQAQQNVIENQQKFAQMKMQFEQDTQQALLSAGLTREKINLELNQIDSTASKMLGSLVRKDGSFVTDENGKRVSVPVDPGLLSSFDGLPGVAFPQGGKYSYNTTQGGGFEIGVQTGQQAGQCGRFCNDVLGGKIFGDDFSQKVSMKNSDIPIPGAAFIQKTDSRWGHVGIVESVSPDGSINVVDSNYGLDEKVRRRTIKRGSPEWQSIVGYYVPPNTIGTKDLYLSQIRNGLITSSDTTKLIPMAEIQGWSNELNQALNDPQNKPISQNTSDQFQVEQNMTQRAFEDLVQKRQGLGYGNRKFQSLNGIQPKDDQLGGLSSVQAFIELGNKIQKIRGTFETFKANGLSFQGFGSELQRGVDYLTEKFGGSAGAPTQLYREIEQETGDTLAQFIKSISGAAVSEPEYRRLAALKPNVTQTNDQFELALNKMEEEYKRASEATRSLYGFSSVNDLRTAINDYGNMPINLSLANNEVATKGGILNDPDIQSVLNQPFSTGVDVDYSNRYSLPR